MLGSGIRVGSAVALDVEDVDLPQEELWLRRTKGDRPDRVMLSRELCRLLTGYIADRRSGPLFIGKRGARITTRHVSRLLASSLEAAERAPEGAVATIAAADGSAIEIPRFSTTAPTRATSGNLDAMPLYAGTGVDAVTRRSTVAEVIAELAAGLP